MKMPENTICFQRLKTICAPLLHAQKVGTHALLKLAASRGKTPSNTICILSLLHVLLQISRALLVWPVLLAQVLPCPQLIFPSKTWFFGIYLNFQQQKSFKNLYLPHSESKSY
jgi:hypothetical protein